MMDSRQSHKKNPNPRESANFLSALTFCYTIPTFILGFKRELEINDLYDPLAEHKSSYLGDKLEKKWKEELIKSGKKKKPPSLRAALVRTFGLEFMLMGIFTAINEIGIKIAQPVFLSLLISYFINSDSDVDIKDAYLYALGIALCSLVSVFLTHPTSMAVVHVGMKMRVACCSLIYRKALRLSKTALGETTVGQVVNLLSNDVSRFDSAVAFVHFLWTAPITCAVVTYLMYREVQMSAIYGILFMLLFIPFQFCLAHKAAAFRFKTALRTDERVRLMNEIISGIQVIKMYTWEKPFAKLIEYTRRHEIQSIRMVSYIRGIIMSFVLINTRITLFISILAYLLYGFNIDAQKVFTLTAYYNVLRQCMSAYFPQGVVHIAEVNVSINRLTKFLLHDEVQTRIFLNPKLENVLNGSVKNKKCDFAISINGATGKWSESLTENTLTNLNLQARRGELIAVVGPVGSGKTSLFHAILKELPLITGSLEVDGVISYASQEPWLFTGTVQNNILFGEEMNKARYKTVVQKCALERDFKLLPYGDCTVVGEKGVSLSGGQKARINLARAVYRNADIYLLDDPLSAVDTHVGAQLFQNCIQEYLRDKTVILVTHQLQYLKDVNHIIILKNGVIKAEGNYRQLQESGLDFAEMLKETEKPQKEVQKISRQESLVLERSTSIRSSISSKYEEAPAVPAEQKGSGSISGEMYGRYIAAGGNWCTFIYIGALFLLSQIFSSFSDFFLTFWTNLEQDRAANRSLYDAFYEQTHYFKSTHNENFYSNNDDHIVGLRAWEPTREVSIYIYSGLTAAVIVFTLVRSFSFFNLSMRASIKLHNSMFKSVIHAPMRFFTLNTSGRILNRFSKDMGAVDELLPTAMVDTLQIGLFLIGVIAVVGIVNYWLMIPTVIVGILFYFFRIFYLKTSRSIKRLEGVTRSPVFAHLNASLQGLTTVRAFQAQTVLEKEFDNHQDLHSSAWFSFLSASRTFAFWLDVFCVIYIVIVTFSFLVIGNETYGGNVGLAITQSISLTGMFQFGMRQSAEMENQMTAVERVIEYTSLEQEPPFNSLPSRKPPLAWPDKGEVNFFDLYLYYYSNDPAVLKNVNFTIKPLEKVGIVGRTGAGKSSLIAALFRLAEISGSVVIDGIDTKHIGLHDLRSKISIIPQEPVLFSGTMRSNLDPFDEYEDVILWKSLEEVELKDAMDDLPHGLSSKISEGGSNFSVGQRQLICLARAIIRNNKILVLDEATANVDLQTDSLVQKTIRRKFADCTVLTVAHRLQTVVDSDKVLVMDAGTLVQFDHPHILLQDKEGIFYGMVQHTGKTMAENLAQIAAESYEKRLQKKDI